MIDGDNIDTSRRSPRIRIREAETCAAIDRVPSLDGVGPTNVREARDRAKGRVTTGETVLPVGAGDGVQWLVAVVISVVICHSDSADGGDEGKEGRNGERGLHDNGGAGAYRDEFELVAGDGKDYLVNLYTNENLARNHSWPIVSEVGRHKAEGLEQ